jgi:hypothetical protein
MGLKISGMTAAVSVNGTDEIEINQAGVTKKATLTQLSTFAGGAQPLLGTFASRPGAGVNGRIYQPSDGYCEFVDNGSLWLPKFQGQICTPPPAAATLTAVNTPTGMTFADDKGTLLIKQSSISTNSLGLIRLSAYPGTPFHLRIGFAFNAIPANIVGWGVFLRDSATSRVQTYAKIYAGSLVKWEVDNYSNATTPASTPIADTFPGYLNFERGFFHFVDPGGTGTLVVGQSQDGDKNNYAICENTLSRTSYVATPDQFGIVLYTNNGTISRGNIALRIFDWSYL